MINIDILGYVLNKEFWTNTETFTIYSGHTYKNSPFETSDSCGNCNGANCDWCKKIIVPPYFEFSIYTDYLYDLLKSKGVPSENATEIAYSDFCRNFTSGDYHLIWPTENMLKERYPDFYKELTECS